MRLLLSVLVAFFLLPCGTSSADLFVGIIRTRPQCQGPSCQQAPTRPGLFPRFSQPHSMPLQIMVPVQPVVPVVLQPVQTLRWGFFHRRLIPGVSYVPVALSPQYQDQNPEPQVPSK